MVEAYYGEMMFLCCDILIGIVKIQMKLCGGCRHLGHVVDGQGESAYSRKVVEETIKCLVLLFPKQQVSDRMDGIVGDIQFVMVRIFQEGLGFVPACSCANRISRKMLVSRWSLIAHRFSTPQSCAEGQRTNRSS